MTQCQILDGDEKRNVKILYSAFKNNLESNIQIFKKIDN
jgi:hypothetical protein